MNGARFVNKSSAAAAAREQTVHGGLFMQFVNQFMTRFHERRALVFFQFSVIPNNPNQLNLKKPKEELIRMH